jgi:hypothetical protein
MWKNSLKTRMAVLLATFAGACASTQAPITGDRPLPEGALHGELPLAMEVCARAVCADGKENRIHPRSGAGHGDPPRE